MTGTEAPEGTPTRAPTIRDVASLAGVGVKTVSRVLNDEPNVRPEMRARVLEAARTLKYRRNSIASAIRRLDQRTASIGLVVEDLANPFAAQLTRAVQDYALRRQHLVLVGSSDGVPERERDLVTEFCSRRVDGLLVVPSGADQSYLEPERDRGTPVVFVDRPGRRIKADTVIADNEAAVRRAVNHLASRGHIRIGYLGDRQSVYTAAQRAAGYREAIREIGREPLDRTGLRDSESAYRAALEMLEAGPTALVCGNNVITAGAVHAMQQLGLRDRVAVIGFDDLELADLLRPALTVLAQDVTGIGERAAELLFGQLAKPGGPYQRITLPVTLIPRGSGELPADGRLHPAGRPDTDAPGG
ncbi:MAG: LacI family DNA-binding transcriptional regulator [Micromonosporaceae bacterium]